MFTEAGLKLSTATLSPINNQKPVRSHLMFASMQLLMQTSSTAVAQLEIRSEHSQRLLTILAPMNAPSYNPIASIAELLCALERIQGHDCLLWKDFLVLQSSNTSFAEWFPFKNDRMLRS